MTDFWIIFMKDPATGIIHGTAYGHNATADYKTNPYYLGTKRIAVDLEKLTTRSKDEAP